MVTRSDTDNINFTAAVVELNQEASPINLMQHLSSSHLLPTACSKEPKDVFLASV